MADLLCELPRLGRRKKRARRARDPDREVDPQKRRSGHQRPEKYVKGKKLDIVNGSCEVHTWPDEGLAERIVEAAKKSLAHGGHGGINICKDCLARAKKSHLSGQTPEKI